MLAGCRTPAESDRKNAQRFERRIFEWDGHPILVVTKDKKLISIDSYARWRISDPKIFLEKVTNEIFAQSCLDDILDRATKIAAHKYDSAEVVPSDKSRKAFSKDILEDAREKVKGLEYGIELLDFQFKRITPYNPCRMFSAPRLTHVKLLARTTLTG